MSIKTQEEASIRHNLSYSTILSFPICNFSFNNVKIKALLILVSFLQHKRKSKLFSNLFGIYLNEIMEWTDDLA